jgi:hypothetical protein
MGELGRRLHHSSLNLGTTASVAKTESGVTGQSHHAKRWKFTPIETDTDNGFPLLTSKPGANSDGIYWHACESWTPTMH